MSDPETVDFIKTKRDLDLIIIDGILSECAMALAHVFNVPFMYINTVAHHAITISLAGNPMPYSVTPFEALPMSDNMSFLERVVVTAFHVGYHMGHMYSTMRVGNVLRKHFGSTIPAPYELNRNVSFILQNSHPIVTYPRPYLPNVVEIGCIHCRPSKPLPKVIRK